ncbi:AAA family ATPase [Paenibacillus yanchengensis]|uniref:AAA family ATPase n=1 Tax=Paenibacillus yanchengensis TaxID=2035833 RepID=A0ABW4YMK6_9BACL
MIVWINGAFGSGKTQTAHELHRRVPESFIFDPEVTGFYIRKQMPRTLQTKDFQDNVLWRDINYQLLKEIMAQSNSTIIVPMTVVHPPYFEEIIGRLRADGIIVHHFTLCASEQTLLRRLKKRGEGKNSWAALQIKRCIEGHSNAIFEQKVDTNHMTIDEVVQYIADQLPMDVLPDTRGTVRKTWDRVMTQWKHIRFF